jgi:hypothetical protein
MHHLFISYSRRDRTFVERLSKALEDRRKETWVDWQDIPPTATFKEEIRAAIDASDSFLFVISPDSCYSPVCKQELAHAAKSQKRLIPIVCRPTPLLGTSRRRANQLDLVHRRSSFRCRDRTTDDRPRYRSQVGAGPHRTARES